MDVSLLSRALRRSRRRASPRSFDENGRLSPGAGLPERHPSSTLDRGAFHGLEWTEGTRRRGEPSTPEDLGENSVGPSPRPRPCPRRRKGEDQSDRSRGWRVFPASAMLAASTPVASGSASAPRRGGGEGSFFVRSRWRFARRGAHSDSRQKELCVLALDGRCERKRRAPHREGRLSFSLSACLLSAVGCLMMLFRSRSAAQARSPPRFPRLEHLATARPPPSLPPRSDQHRPSVPPQAHC